ncbi:CRISPR-associated DxTHG motif protein [Aliarcobacter cryaerophilus]|uniref:CRISPR-associated DxTHG motif protein n=1 Tax=Aliarcobacter cryaerophilus TaxID=28198 RepID=UPI003DA42E6A
MNNIKGLKIVSKANSNIENNPKSKENATVKSKVVVSILGIQGGYIDDKKEAKFTNFENKADYIFESVTKEFFNTLPLLIEKYAATHKIIPIFTEDAKIFNKAVLDKGYPSLSLDFMEDYYIKDDKNFEDIFKIINQAISSYNEVIVDVSHGFRHLPILMIVDLIIQNFQDTSKISKILFAKEIKRHEKDSKGLYEIIDLKEYLDLANISFVLTTFAKNYTVASHIKSEKYNDLIEKLNSFSNDLMALNQNNLFRKTSKELIKALDKIEDISIKNQADDLKKDIVKLTDHEGKKRYETYYNLAKDLYEKKYMLLSLSLLYESIRLYVKTYIKNKENGKYKVLVENIENQFNNDLYKIGDFFKNLKWKTYKQLLNDKKTIISISEANYQKLKNSFPNGLKELYDKIDRKRNNLAHANSDNKTFQDIESDIKKLFDEYYEKCIKKQDIADLKKKFM